MRKFISTLLTLVLLSSTVVYGVTDDTQIVDKEAPQASDIALKSFSSCDGMEKVLRDYFKANILEQMTAYGTPTLYKEGGMMMRDAVTSVAAPTAEMAKSSTASGIGGGGYSTTNIQVTGIDESEVVKTDGKYIYYASNTPGTDGFQYVTITKASPAKDMELIKRIKLPTNYSNIQLYLADGLLTILADKYNTDYVSPMSMITMGGGSKTAVIVYDVGDPTKPILKRFATIDGNLSQSRRDGDFLYVLSQNYIGFNFWGPMGMYAREDVSAFFDKKFDVKTMLPRAVDIRTIKGSTLDVKGQKMPYKLDRVTTDCNSIEYFLPEKPQNLSFVTLSIIPLKSDASITQKVIYGDVSQFYMSEKSLYIVGNYYKRGGNFPCPMGARCLMPAFINEQNSLVHRMTIGGGQAKYAYSILTPGIPLSQYAMDERDGVLFMANQKDWSTNGVDVFAVDNAGKLLSKLENVGAKERFQAARYIGNRLYLVTFQQTDPLFVIDTTSPSAMKVMGELVMPGYSTYLHPYDATHLIGIGYDTKASQWGGTMNSGIKVDLYDVADITKPKQQYTATYGGIGSSSDALWNPRSLVWDEGRKNLLINASLLDQNSTTYQYTSAWQGLLVINISPSTGIKKDAQISHIDMTGIAEKRREDCKQYTSTSTEEKCYTHIVTGEKICSKSSLTPEQTIPLYCYSEYDDTSYLATNLWNFSSSFVQRGLYIGDTLYSVSPSFIQANTYGGAYAKISRVGNN